MTIQLETTRNHPSIVINATEVVFNEQPQGWIGFAFHSIVGLISIGLFLIWLRAALSIPLALAPLNDIISFGILTLIMLVSAGLVGLLDNFRNNTMTHNLKIIMPNGKLVTLNGNHNDLYEVYNKWKDFNK